MIEDDEACDLLFFNRDEALASLYVQASIATEDVEGIYRLQVTRHSFSNLRHDNECYRGIGFDEL